MNSNHFCQFLNQTQTCKFPNYKYDIKNIQSNFSFYSKSPKKSLIRERNLKISIDMSKTYKLTNSKKYILNSDENKYENKNIGNNFGMNQVNNIISLKELYNKTRNSNLKNNSTDKKIKQNNFSMRLKNKNNKRLIYHSSNISQNISPNYIYTCINSENKKYFSESKSKEDEKVDCEGIERKKFIGIIESNQKQENSQKKKFNLQLINNLKKNSPEEIHFSIVNKIQKIKYLSKFIN